MKKKVYWEDKKKKPARQEYNEKAKINSMQCRMMSSDIYFILYMDNLSRKQSKNLGQ